MTTSVQKFLDVLTDSPQISDLRMNRFLMKSPLQLITILGLYLATVLLIGPRLMRNRKPFSLKTTIVAYNVAQICWNLYLFLGFAGLSNNLSIVCTPYEKSNRQEVLQMIELHYRYILLKHFDLVETMFFVLRKKERQVSFLHVYHHVGILLAAWVSGKYFPGGQAIFVGLYNTFVHLVMYCYYLLSSYKSSETLWWKKYVTLLQIVQHCLVFLCVFPSVVNPNCSYPKFWMGLFSINVLFIIYLFGKFYKNTYLDKKRQ